MLKKKNKRFSIYVLIEYATNGMKKWDDSFLFEPSLLELNLNINGILYLITSSEI